MHRSEAGMAGPGALPDDSLQTAVRDCLAPLRLSEIFEPVAEYVLRGTGPRSPASLRGRPPGADMVVKPNDVRSAERAAAVTGLHPGWSQREAAAARLTVYRDAPIDVLARFGQVLHAAADRPPASGEPSWLLVLADDALRVCEAADGADAEGVRRRWGPHILVEVAGAGAAPAGLRCTPPCRRCCTRTSATRRAVSTGSWCRCTPTPDRVGARAHSPLSWPVPFPGRRRSGCPGSGCCR
ncbi:hypothetical protein [Nocardiopsis valliformis]|uniref:hypothetical protein n=1 Tax=Nocardiopsis valliformis TaxID=239974 RepID=UPI0003475FA6|nr:hypothetical protein [Nocardiopsis valliformis]